MNQIKPILELSRVNRVKGLLTKKKLFEKLAEFLASESGCSFHRVLDSLNGREKLGSTCIGKGVAIPHCKLKIDTARAAILVFDEPVRYSEDGSQQVDIVFGLLVPEDNCEQHLHILSSIARLCEQDSWLDGLRQIDSEQDIATYVSEAEPDLGVLL